MYEGIEKMKTRNYHLITLVIREEKGIIILMFILQLKFKLWMLTSRKLKLIVD